MSAQFNTQTTNGEYRLQFETDNKETFLQVQKYARRIADGKSIVMELKDTVDAMCSEDYKARFVAEYYQTKIRYEKLKKFNTKIEAARHLQYSPKEVAMPKHDCPDMLLAEQQTVMGNYLHLLEVRAEIEGIEL